MALGKFGEAAQSAIPEVSKLLKDEHAIVREAALQSLWEIGGIAKTEVPSVVKLLADEKSSTRWLAAAVLRYMQDESLEAFAQLCQILFDKNIGVACQAAESLGYLAKNHEWARDAKKFLERARDEERSILLKVAAESALREGKWN